MKLVLGLQLNAKHVFPPIKEFIKVQIKLVLAIMGTMMTGQIVFVHPATINAKLVKVQLRPIANHVMAPNLAV